MNKLVLSLIMFLISTCTAKAAEVLDVLVVYDTNSVTSIAAFDTEIERSDLSNVLVQNLNTSFSRSGLGNDIQFRLVASVLRPVKTSTSETADSVQTRYRAQFSSNKARNNPVLTLNTHQKSYKADVVIGVMSFPGATYEGFSLYNIGKNFQNAGFSSLAESIGFADYGIVFLKADVTTIKKEYVVAHEVGHSMGLWHGADQDPDYNTYFPYMFTGAEGYTASELTSLGYQSYGTIMKGNKINVNNNVFSSPLLNNCGAGPFTYSKVCGTNTKNAVSVLRLYKSFYNKRGAWYGN